MGVISNQKILISFLIPVYNVEQYLERCLDAIYCQIEQDCEVILIDDGSTDESGSICERYKNKFSSSTYVFHNENHGSGFARNFALDRAHGAYIWFVDADDKITSDAVFRIRSVLNNNHNIDIITAGFKRFSEDSVGKLENSFASQMLSGENYLTHGFFNPYLWCNIYRHDFLRKKHIRFRDDLVSQEDWLFNAYAYAASKRIQLCDFQIYFYFKGNPNSTLSRRDKNHLLRGIENSMKAQFELWDFVQQHSKTPLYKPLRKWLSFTSAGLFYSLFHSHHSLGTIKDVISIYKEKGLYPIGWSNNKRANVFAIFANCKWLFLTTCAIRNSLFKGKNKKK